MWPDSRYYILTADGEPVAVPDVITWGTWYETSGDERRVLRTSPVRAAVVSTVFLALDHSWSVGPPVLWETMIFGGVFDGYQDRYASRLDALVGHARAESLVAVYPELPRRTKWAVRKWARYPARLRPAERVLVARVLRQVGVH